MQDPEGHPEGGDKVVFSQEFMYLMGRIITLPIPSICVVNGHAFGAGFMLALAHDVRFMREDRGFLSANEMQLDLKYLDQNWPYLDIKFLQIIFRPFNYPSVGLEKLLLLELFKVKVLLKSYLI